MLTRQSAREINGYWLNEGCCKVEGWIHSQDCYVIISVVLRLHSNINYFVFGFHSIFCKIFCDFHMMKSRNHIVVIRIFSYEAMKRREHLGRTDDRATTIMGIASEPKNDTE